MTEQPRDRDGAHTKGRWVKAEKAGPGFGLEAAAGTPLRQLRDGVEPSAAALPDERPADWEPFGNAVDRLVDSVHQGPLSRGIVKTDRYMNYTGWQSWAVQRSRETRIDDPEASSRYDQFAIGMEHAALALMSDKAEFKDDYVVNRLAWQMGSHARPGDVHKSRTLLTFKRTSKASRAEWAEMAQQAPSTPAWRGYLTAAAVLSGTDHWWGLRDDPDDLVQSDDAAVADR